MYFETIKEYYNDNLYDKSDVKQFVQYGWLTEAQYEDITGEVYTAV